MNSPNGRLFIYTSGLSSLIEDSWGEHNDMDLRSQVEAGWPLGGQTPDWITDINFHTTVDPTSIGWGRRG
jgi:hypothetical protein